MAEIKSKLQELKRIVEDLNNAHAVYHEQLVDVHDIEESNQYFDAMKLSTSDLAGKITNWIISSKNASPRLPPEEPSPEDSISNVASCANSKLSHHSKSSSIGSISSAKAKAAAKRATLEAEAATLETFQAIQREELSLQLRKQALELQTDIAKAQAEELVYAIFQSLVKQLQIGSPWYRRFLPQCKGQIIRLWSHKLEIPYHPRKLKSLSKFWPETWINQTTKPGCKELDSCRHSAI
ncbi:hypothetical protein OS493_017525 [Desmophyllum pertusum]|uniref:Uncharacterized protein n=1 Tax=Desmophyllum pertusum TaxID=174260 RepID=A0A9W9ZPL9_9CNID|nr:hypothetical protein OS493_017525 [Desmophyllum pertusum]